jgi:hypothetical protein
MKEEIIRIVKRGHRKEREALIRNEYKKRDRKKERINGGRKKQQYIEKGTGLETREYGRRDPSH